MNNITLLLDNIRSLHNVGSILRTADAVGVQSVICCGFTPYPRVKDDPRPEFEIRKTTTAIAKTALGAEASVPCSHFESVLDAIINYREQGYQIAALEQAINSVNLFEFRHEKPLLLMLGQEVAGHDQAILDEADVILEIPMVGQKESLNVSVAAGVALYQLCFGA